MKGQWHLFIQVLAEAGGDSTMCRIYLSTHLAKEISVIFVCSIGADVMGTLTSMNDTLPYVALIV